MHVRKAALVCNSCGAKVEVDPTRDRIIISPFARPDDPLTGWLDLGGDRHLCPTCAKPYLEKRREMEEELRRLSGTSTIEFEI